MPSIWDPSHVTSDIWFNDDGASAYAAHTPRGCLWSIGEVDLSARVIVGDETSS